MPFVSWHIHGIYDFLGWIVLILALESSAALILSSTKIAAKSACSIVYSSSQVCCSLSSWTYFSLYRSFQFLDMNSVLFSVTHLIIMSGPVMLFSEAPFQHLSIVTKFFLHLWICFALDCAWVREHTHKKNCLNLGIAQIRWTPPWNLGTRGALFKKMIIDVPEVNTFFVVATSNFSWTSLTFTQPPLGHLQNKWLNKKVCADVSWLLQGVFYWTP